MREDAQIEQWQRELANLAACRGGLEDRLRVLDWSIAAVGLAALCVIARLLTL